MASQGVERTRRLFGSASFPVPTSHVTYDTLMRQSKKLGHVATQTLDGAKQGARQIFGQKAKRAPIVDKDIIELKKVVAHSREVLANAKTVLPFLFPHEITLDRTKISIIKRNFFWSSNVVSVRIEDTLNVSASVGPLFGSITVTSRVMSSVDHYTLEHFWRSDAIKLKQIIQGYLIARQDGIHTDHLKCDELAETLHELGRDM